VRAGRPPGYEYQETYLFAAGTGALEHTWPGVLAGGADDLDGDGLNDLYGYSGGKLHTVRGLTPELWRRPGRWAPAWPWHWDATNIPARPRTDPVYLTLPLPKGDLDGDGVPDVLIFWPGQDSSKPPGEPEVQAYSGKTGRRLWQAHEVPDGLQEFFPGRVEKLEHAEKNEAVLRKAKPGRWRWARGDEPGRDDEWLRRFRWNAPDDPPERITSPADVEVTYCRRALPAGEPAQPLTFDFSGIDPRLSVPLPWVEPARDGWQQALGWGLVYLVALTAFAITRRWRAAVWLLLCLVLLPAVLMPWQFDGGHHLLAEECRDWSGWYWFWPFRLSLWGGDAWVTNLLFGTAVWVVLVIVWRRRRARPVRARK
jgi:hypothetical protein